MPTTEHARQTLLRYDCKWNEGWPDFESRVVANLVRHWRDLFQSRDGEIPRKSEIDPILIGPTLSRVYIYEAHGDEFICRLAGEQISWNFDVRLKDRALAEIVEPAIHEMVRLFMRVCLDEPAIYRNHGLLYSDSRKRKISGERVFLPLRGEDGGMTFLIGLTDVTSLSDAPTTPTRSFHPCSSLTAPTPGRSPLTDAKRETEQSA